MVLAEKEPFEIQWLEIAKLSLLAISFDLGKQVIKPEEKAEEIPEMEFAQRRLPDFLRFFKNRTMEFLYTFILNSYFPRNLLPFIQVKEFKKVYQSF